MRLLRRDRGLQPERTRLAWRRTMLLGSAVALLGVRLSRGEPLPLAGMVIAWLVLLRVGYWRLLMLSTHQPQRMLPPVALLAAGTVVAFAALGVLGALSH